MCKCSNCKSELYTIIRPTSVPVVTEDKAYANFYVTCNNCGHIYVINKTYICTETKYHCEYQ